MPLVGVQAPELGACRRSVCLPSLREFRKERPLVPGRHERRPSAFVDFDHPRTECVVRGMPQRRLRGVPDGRNPRQRDVDAPECRSDPQYAVLDAVSGTERQIREESADGPQEGQVARPPQDVGKAALQQDQGRDEERGRPPERAPADRGPVDPDLSAPSAFPRLTFIGSRSPASPVDMGRAGTLAHDRLEFRRSRVCHLGAALESAEEAVDLIAPLVHFLKKTPRQRRGV